tara:strand:+ start:1749 stop:2192 length:444 start_codon:yes stop_codon:yes gene_type:complete
MSVEVTMDFDLDKINLDLHKELNFIGEIIKKDHYQRLEKGKGVKGGMQQLRPSTVKKKGHGKILVDTGKMRNLVIEEATRANQMVEVHPGRIEKYKGSNVTMADVGGFHQEGGGNLPKREWFGITKDAEKRALKHIELRIEQEIRRA